MSPTRNFKLTVSDPWAGIASASSVAVFSGRRAAPEQPFNFFWARDFEGRRLLALHHNAVGEIGGPRPKLNGIDIIEREPALGEKGIFILALKQHEAVELFTQLCQDIMASVAGCANDTAALSAVIRRAWKWHSLLRSGGSSRLSEIEQQGLFGELLMLQRLIEHFGAAEGLSFWRGPLDEPKDFRVGISAIEVKTRQGGRHSVEITSAHQLDPQGVTHLILAVMHLAPAASFADDAKSLDSLIAELRNSIAMNGIGLEQFEALLIAAGWNASEGYNAPSWLLLGTEYYDATGDFPKIAAATLAPGVDQVRYRLSLDACGTFTINEATLVKWLAEG